MRYLAILKDSFRESLDSKVLYVTLGLSGLLLLFLAGIDFRNVTFQERLEELIDNRNERIAKFSPSAPTTLELQNFEQLDPEAKPWESGYKFDVVFSYPKNGKKDAQQAVRQFQREIFYKKLKWLNKEGREMKVEPPMEVEIDKGVFEFLFGKQGAAIPKKKAKKSQEKPGEGVPKNKDNDDKPASPPGEYRLSVHVTGTTIENAKNWEQELRLFYGLWETGGYFAPATLVFNLQTYLISGFGAWVVILAGVIVTGFFIPNMVQKGTVDLLLSKPVDRAALLVFKYIGGLTFVLLNSAVAIGGAWLVFGLRAGVWTWSGPTILLIILFNFSLLYAISTLFGVLTKNSVGAISITLTFWFLLWSLGVAYQSLNQVKQVMSFQAEAEGKQPEMNSVFETSLTVVDAVHTVVPRSDDLGILTEKLTSQEMLSEKELEFVKAKEKFVWSKEMRERYSSREYWIESFAISSGYLIVLIALACWRFAVRDY
ncbi:MAG: ABC transporter permease [Gemmataceae bacterium]